MVARLCISVVADEMIHDYEAVYSCGAPAMLQYVGSGASRTIRMLILHGTRILVVRALAAPVVHVAGQDESSSRVCEDGPVFERHDYCLEGKRMGDHRYVS